MNPNDPDPQLPPTPKKVVPPETGPPKAVPVTPATPVKPAAGTQPPKPVPVKPTPVAQPVKPVPVKPVAARPVSPAPVAPQPVAPKPVPVKPVPVKPVSPTPVAPKPVAAKPVAPRPVQPKPVAPAPVPVKPVAPAPVVAKPVAAKPAQPQPVPVKSARPVPVTPVAAATIAGGAARPIPVAAPTPDDELAMVGEGPEDPDEADEEAEADVKRLKKSAPPWLVSTIVHTLVVLLAGFWFWPTEKQDAIEFEATFAEVEGEQLEDDTVDLIAEDDEMFEDEDFTDEVVLDPVDDPLTAPMDFIPDLNPVGMSAEFVAPTIGKALEGRNPGMKAGLLKAYGGTKSTEKAVASGLGWLKKNMDKKSGGWSLVGPYEDGGLAENEVAATAMAVLAFQGAGHTTKEGNYRPELNRAWKFLLSRQGPQGNFQLSKGAPHNHAFYTHGQVSIALCELYALTGDEELREPAQNAINYLVKTQADDGGWRYQPNKMGDLSVTGWAVMALQSARMAGLEVNSPSLDRISEFLDLVSVEEKTKYCYIPRDPPTPTMTAEGLLCRQYLGWHHDEPALLTGTKYISDNPIQWREPDHYYWYYATQVMHHMEGTLWEDWNAVMRVEIPKHQVQSGKEAGSWYDENDRWSSYGGRLYTTCLSIYMLEVYYRHLPLYNSVYSQE